MEDGADPEDTYTDIPYEKGYAFVSYLRHLVGSDEAFDAWLKVRSLTLTVHLRSQLAPYRPTKTASFCLDWLPDPCRCVHVSGRPM